MSGSESSRPEPPKPSADASSHRKLPDYALVALGMFLLLVPLGFLATWPALDSNSVFAFNLRVITALGGALVGAAIPGLIEVNLPFARSAGAMGVFLLIFLVNPPGLVRTPGPTKTEDSVEVATMNGGEAITNLPVGVYDDFSNPSIDNTFDKWARLKKVDAIVEVK